MLADRRDVVTRISKNDSEVVNVSGWYA